MEMKQFIIILAIFTVIIMGFSFASNSYINVDNWNKGELKEVTFEYPACLVEACYDHNKPASIVDPASMKKLENVFFGKVTDDFLGYWHPQGQVKVTFIYDMAILVFDANINFETDTGTFNFISKRRGYQLSKSDIEILKVFIEE
jgi:hypothetical protein